MHPAPCLHMVYFSIVVGVILLDHPAKYAVSISDGAGRIDPGNFSMIFHITYVQNLRRRYIQYDARAVGILILLPCAAILTALIILFWKRKNWNICMNLAIAFICGGGLGNLIDRITQGYVVDLFDFRSISCSRHRRHSHLCWLRIASAGCFRIRKEKEA